MSLEVSNTDHINRERNERVVRRLVHELMNPLGSISLTAESLQLEYPDNDTVKILSKSVDRMTRLIKSYAFATKKPEITLAGESLNDIISTTVETLKSSISLKNPEVRIHLNDPDLMVQADRTKLQEAIMHLLINAMEASDLENGVIEISTTVQDRFATISIRNSGKIIPAEDMGQLFDPLFTTKSGHMGLGLNYAECIVLAHNGSLKIVNLDGEGVEAQIRLPA